MGVESQVATAFLTKCGSGRQCLAPEKKLGLGMVAKFPISRLNWPLVHLSAIFAKWSFLHQLSVDFPNASLIVFRTEYDNICTDTI